MTAFQSFLALVVGVAALSLFADHDELGRTPFVFVGAAAAAASFVNSGDGTTVFGGITSVRHRGSRRPIATTPTMTTDNVVAMQRQRITTHLTWQPISSSSLSSRRIQRPASRQSSRLFSSRRSSSSSATTRSITDVAGGVNDRRGKELLSRRTAHFVVDQGSSGKIEFGLTAPLTTQLVAKPAPLSINRWLEDERGLALSIWDEKLTRDLGNSIYRLQIMTLQFVTIQLAPWVDVEMKTTMVDADGGGGGQQPSIKQRPVFTLQSKGYDPNIQVLPGMKISAESLGIVIEVAGELTPSRDGTGVSGTIAFQTSGELPLPLRIVPRQVLEAAAETINSTVMDFAKRSFQQGARQKYREFVREQQKQRRQEQEQRKAVT